MDGKKLGKIRRELEDLLRSPQGRRSSTFTSIAKKLGRVDANRGKEPTWIKNDDPTFDFPLSIPQHPKDMPTGTARSIIDQLLDDVDVWQQHLDQLKPPQKECKKP